MAEWRQNLLRHGRADAEPDGDFAGRFPSLMAIDKPIIAAINGAVAGMAYPFALCCDLRVVTPDALFLTAFAQRGLIAEWGLSWVLPRLVGPAVALDLLFSSRRVKGDEALALGLANYLVEPDELLGFCRDYIVDLATQMFAGLDRGDEAPGVRATPRGTGLRRARRATSDGGELRSAGLRRRRALLRREASAAVPPPRRLNARHRTRTPWRADLDGGLVEPAAFVNN